MNFELVPHPEIVERLARCDLFAGLDRPTLTVLAGAVERLKLEPKETVCRQGDAGDRLYVIVQGRFSVSIAGPRGLSEVQVRTMEPGDFFGESALLTEHPRPASVRCEDAGEVLALERSRFLELLRVAPTTGIAVATTLSHRLETSAQALLAQVGGLGTDVITFDSTASGSTARS